MSHITLSHRHNIDPATLSHDAIVIYAADFRDFVSEVEGLNLILSATEQQRAERLFFPEDQLYKKVSLALTKIILAQWVSCDPTDIVFEYGPNGKPFCVNRSGVSFNISHSRDQFLMAVTRDREVGIDIEAVKDSRDLLALSQRYFSDTEIAYLHSLPQSDQDNGFYEVWACKEAFIKLIGKGLAFDLTAFDIMLSDPNEEPKIVVRDAQYQGRMFELMLYDLCSQDNGDLSKPEALAFNRVETLNPVFLKNSAKHVQGACVYKAALAFESLPDTPINTLYSVTVTSALYP